MKNIGIIIPSSENGGVFQYALSIAESLIDYSGDCNYFLIYSDLNKSTSLFSPKLNSTQHIVIPNKVVSFPKKITHFLGLFFGLNFLLIKDFYFIIKKNNIDFLIYPTPSTFDFFPYKIPFVVCIPDLMHKYYPFFPEYNIKVKITRNIIYGYFAKNSIINIVDSEQGSRDLQRFFKISEKKIHIIYYVPPDYVYQYRNMEIKTAEELLATYGLPDKFLFYPAQFWYHKNHVRLINALNLIKRKNRVDIPLVLVGSSRRENSKRFKKITGIIKELGMEYQVFHLGFVSDKEIVALYKKSVALVFPTLIGPTNIPPLEAIILGTPVICSNLFEMPNQIGKAGMFFNPFKEEDMAEKIYKVWQNQELREELIKYGKKKNETITLDNYNKQWREVINKVL